MWPKAFALASRRRKFRLSNSTTEGTWPRWDLCADVIFEYRFLLSEIRILPYLLSALF
jgi:hypothetical protein